MRSCKTYFLFVAAILAHLSFTNSLAQTISAQVDRDKIMIGEKILLTIKVEGVKPNTVSSWVNFPDTVNHFEVVERGKIDTIEVDNIINYQQVMNITSFDSGRWDIPALVIASRAGPLKTLPITVDVMPVDVSHLKDYHDIKEIVEVKDERSKLIIILLIIVTLIALVIVYWLLRRNKNAPRVVKREPEDNRGPLEWAMAELNKLQQEDLPAQGAVKQFYQRMTDISRQYFYRQLRHSAIHQTTDEWMLSLQDLPVNSQTKTSFFQFIRLADTVKFAKYLPPAEEHNNSLHAAADMFKSVAAWKESNTASNVQR